jgi:hypothetical protein
MVIPRRGVVLLGLWLGLALVAGCAAPIGVQRADPGSVHRQLTGNVLSTGELSDFSRNSLRVAGLPEDDAAAALSAGHALYVQGIAGPPALFTLSELAFKHAAEGGGQPYYLLSAVYAFAYLFPEDGGEAPASGVDWRAYTMSAMPNTRTRPGFSPRTTLSGWLRLPLTTAIQASWTVRTSRPAIQARSRRSDSTEFVRSYLGAT